ncbi:MAG: Sir2 family NAD-dependent protein deacetylase [Chryseolinea sp.]
MSDTQEGLKKDVETFRNLIEQADRILIGAGAGLSAASGLQYMDQKTFMKYFPGYNERYGLRFIYEAAFYPFKTQEEFFAYWGKHISTIRYNYPVGEAYSKLFDLVKSKSVFVITTNVDGQFEKAGFSKDKIFSPQGDYAYFQCTKPCSEEIYHNKKWINDFLEDVKITPFAIKSEHVPRCPRCGGNLEPNIRKAGNFVEQPWIEKTEFYRSFIEEGTASSLLLLEIGVGFNTPSIIRFPFENLAARYKSVTHIRINAHDTEVVTPKGNRSYLYKTDINYLLGVNQYDL